MTHVTRETYHDVVIKYQALRSDRVVFATGRRPERHGRNALDKKQVRVVDEELQVERLRCGRGVGRTKRVEGTRRAGGETELASSS